jgi:RNA polymerase sigma-70 factor, ECF subfamily
VPDSEEAQDPREHRFRDIYSANYGRVRAYALRRLASPDDAADVVAEVFTTAWRRLADVPAPPNDRLWLYGVARRAIAGHQRGTRRLRNLRARLASSALVRQPSISSHDPVQDPLLAAVDSLPPAEREALRLVLWEQLSHADAAKVIGCSVNAVGIRVHRAKARLREALGPAPADDGSDRAAGSGRADRTRDPAAVLLKRTEPSDGS